MKTTLEQPYKQFFGTLANQHRLDIINGLEHGPKNVSELCKQTNKNQTTMSHNLTRLEICGFVAVKQDGKKRIYTLNQKTIKPLLKLMHKHMNEHCKHVIGGTCNE
ncbi:MAG: winged helix-turn-helix domain-containing protein [Candidatus Woesearchaeota archaeon]|nr:winged helix-turn-helix domain-containing protein [Candidatus Woesearchaeota archaeon]